MRYKPFLVQTHKALELDTAKDLFAPPVLWAIPHLIPCHRLSLIVAPSGTGLTHLACRMLASVAQPDTLFGPACPDDSCLPTALPDPSSPPGPGNEPAIRPTLPPMDDPVVPTALLITFRDNPDVLRPRLLAAGANPDQVLIVSEVHDRTDDQHHDPYTRPFRPDDLSLLAALLHENKAIRLVLIDSAHLLFSSSNRPSRAKIDRQLQAFIDLAQTRECAIVFLTSIPHLCANPFRSTILAALHEACRMVYLLAPDPDDPGRRYLLHLKQTLAEPTLSLHLHPASSSLPSSIFRLPSFLHASPTDLTYTDYLQQRNAPKQRGPIPHARLMAQAFLTHLLSPGQPIAVGHEHHPEPDSLRAQARSAGLSWGTVRRAMNHLPIQSLHKDNHWFWHLPAPELLPSIQPPPCAPPPETCAPCVPPLPVGEGAGGEGAYSHTPETCAPCTPPVIDLTQEADASTTTRASSPSSGPLSPSTPPPLHIPAPDSTMPTCFPLAIHG